MRAFIYVLHFDKKLKHAGHYIGSTISLKNRLTDHANGQGSAICRHLAKIGAHWKLAALYETTTKYAKKIERRCKDHHRGSHWCPTCTPTPYTPPAAAPYDIELLPFEATSQSLRTNKDYSFDIRPATLEDCGSIKSIQKCFNEDLGFIPLKGQGGFTIAIAKGRVAVAVRNKKVVAFTIWTHNENYVTIHQCAVDPLCHLQGIGRELVKTVCEGFEDFPVRCGVREDLPANAFWIALGFEQYSTRTHKTSGSTINLYERKANNGL